MLNLPEVCGIEREVAEEARKERFNPLYDVPRPEKIEAGLTATDAVNGA